MTLEQIVYVFGLLIATIFVQVYMQIRKVNTLARTQTENVANIAQSKSDIDTLRTDLDRERELRQQLERERDNLLNKVQALQDRVTGMITSGAKQADQLLALQLENASLKGRLEEQREIYTTQIKDLQRQVNDLQSALMTSKSNEGDLSSRLLTAQADLVVAQRDVSHLTAQVQALEGKVKALQAEKMARVLNTAVAPAEKLATPAPKPSTKPAPKPGKAKARKLKAVPA